MIPMLRKLALATLAACLVSCGGGSADNQAAFRIINALPDAPTVNFTIDGATIVDNNFTSLLDYRAGTGFIFVTPGSYDLLGQELLFGRDAQVINPLPPESTIVALPGATLAKGIEYTLITVGKHAAGHSIETLLIENPLAAPAAGKLQLQVVNGDPDSAGVDFYLTAPGADLAASAPFASLDFKEYSTAEQLPAGSYQLRMTPVGDPSTVIFDAGTFTLNAGNSLLMTIMQNLAPGLSPVSLAVNDGFRQYQVFGIATPSDVRVVNASPDAPPIKVTATDTTVDAGANPPQLDYSRVLTESLPFPDFTDYVSLVPDTYTFKALDAANPATVLFQFASTPLVGTRFTLLAYKLLASITYLVLLDDIRSVQTQGKIRIVNASPAAGTVDMYASLPDVPITSATPSFRSLVLGGTTSFLALAIGPYRFTFVKAGTDPLLAEDILLVKDIDFTAGSVKQLILRDTAGGGLPAGLIEMDYAAP